MKRNTDRRARSVQQAEISPDLSALLDEIEKEPVPEKLLELAQELQKKLVEKHRQEDEAADVTKTPSRTRVRQSP